MTDNEPLIRDQLVQRLRGRGAHMPFQQAVAGFPMDRINEKFPNGDYSSWALLEHLRLTQNDILEYCTNPNYQHRPHPEGYWPAPDAVATPDDWQKTVDVFLAELDALIAIVENRDTDLYAPIPWGGDHTILREILIIADHNAYHVGELAIMRQVMGTWPAERG
jgi:hypothetical protein